jgi:hypothetical protein
MATESQPLWNGNTAQTRSFGSPARENKECRYEPGAVLFLPTRRTSAIVAHICTDRSGHRGLRARTPHILGIDAKERTVGDAASFACPFFPSSRVPEARFRVERIGRLNYLEADDGALEKSIQTLQPDERTSLPSASFPGSKTRQDSTFPGGQCAARNFHPPAGSLRMSGMLWEIAFGLQNRLRSDGQSITK